jgi:hypothetical protein
LRWYVPGRWDASLASLTVADILSGAGVGDPSRLCPIPRSLRTWRGKLL